MEFSKLLYANEFYSIVVIIIIPFTYFITVYLYFSSITHRFLIYFSFIFDYHK